MLIPWSTVVPLRWPSQQVLCKRFQSQSAATVRLDILRRSYLYVPCSSDRMLEKSLSSKSDVVIYDLEDSVPPSTKHKTSARERLVAFLGPQSKTRHPRPEAIAVRLNDVSTPFFHSDISEVLCSPSVRTLVLPKIHSAQDLDRVSHEAHDTIQKSGGSTPKSPLNLIASIESAKGLWNLGEIASWKSEHGEALGGRLSALLFAAEDFCADTSIIRSPSRRELLFARSQIVIAAKAFNLDAIDMVCVNYKDLDYLKEECTDGRQLGFNGKQAIHPTQVDIIQSTFVPTEKEILRAAKILHHMEAAHALQKGAYGLELEGGGKEMIDAPMLKQAIKTIGGAKAAGLQIPQID